MPGVIPKDHPVTRRELGDRPNHDLAPLAGQRSREIVSGVSFL